ncbi:MAG: hypothetical protein A6F70_10605 [Cycloclasticus sp. symbiont of Bathymodiolus heckerae]|nr:MAG: hypothetical protein A6F70_10605 [Cycloclasticus sp. symbiont of Bathymodiolus heckerae]
MKLYVGMDLHSTNVVTQIINEEDSVVYRKKQGCDLYQILKGLEPFQTEIEGIAVESTMPIRLLPKIMERKSRFRPILQSAAHT